MYYFLLYQSFSEHAYLIIKHPLGRPARRKTLAGVAHEVFQGIISQLSAVEL